MGIAHLPIDGSLVGPAWIIHKSYAPAFHILSGHPPSRVVLEAGAQATIKVVDHAGQPVVDAQILHELSPPESFPRTPPFSLRFPTSTTGTTRLQLFNGKQSISAVDRDRSSVPWTGSGDEDQTLTLTVGISLAARGTVLTTPPNQHHERPRVECFLRSDSGFTPLGSSTVGNEQWGPIPIPWVNNGEYWFKVSAPHLVTAYKTINSPPPDREIFVEFTPRAAATLRVTATDENASPIPDAEITVTWNIGLEDSGSTSAKTGPTGSASIGGVAPGTVFVSARRESYVTAKTGPLVVTLGDNDSIALTLRVAGRLEGRCLLNGIPAAEFQVVFWKGHPHSQETVAFDNPVNGAFRIDEIPTGEVSLYAVSTNHPQGDTVTVNISPNQTARVELALASSTDATGQVLDASTGTPIPTALIQHWSNSGISLQAKRGDPMQVDANGFFRGQGFREGVNRFTVSAPGYAYQICQAYITLGSQASIGTIALNRLRPLQVRLHSPGVSSFSGYSLRAKGPQSPPIREFSKEGIARIEEAVPGLWELNILGPNDLEIYTQTLLDPGRVDWDIHVSLDTGNALAVDILGGTTEYRAHAEWLSVECLSNQGDLMNLYARFDRGEANLTGLPVGPAFLSVHDSSWNILGVSTTSIIAGLNKARVPIGSTSFSIRIASPEGAPLAGAQVNVFAPTENRGYSLYDITGSTGEVRFTHPPYEHLFATVHHPDFGYLTGVELHLSGVDSELVDIQLPLPSDLRVRLLDGPVALSGIQARLSDPHDQFLIGIFASDNTGLLEKPGFCEGEFLISVHLPNYWPTAAVVSVAASGGTTQLQVRRLADVDLELRSTSGLTVRDRPVVLHSIEFDTDVAEWIASGKVELPGGMVTDSTGHLRIQGLPRGEYRWTVFSAGGAPSSGSVKLAPWTETAVSILVD